MDHLRHIAKADRKLMIYERDDLQIIRQIVQIFPSFEILRNAATQRLKSLQRELGQPTDITASQIRANMNSQGLPLDAASFGSWRESMIQTYVEAPCQPMLRRIMDNNYQPINSNAYRTQPKGPDYEYGLKGVWWQNPERIQDKFYTSLITGRTHAISAAGDYSAPVDVGIDFNDCLAGDEYYQSLGIETPTPPKRAPRKRGPANRLG
jgi:hypothetical protein